MGNVYEVYDIPSKSLHKAEIVDFVKNEKWNSIVCADVETGELYEINENYVNFNNELWWMYDKSGKNGCEEFKQYYSFLFDKETDCFYKNEYKKCIVKSIDESITYTPKFNCEINGKKVSLYLSDINYEFNDSEQWCDAHLKSQPDYISRVTFVNEYSKHIGKKLEVRLLDNKVVTAELVDVNMQKEIKFKLQDGRIVNVNVSDINFTDNKFYLYNKHQLDPLPVYNELYKELIGSEVQMYFNYTISNVILKGFETTKRSSYSYYDMENYKSRYEVKCIVSDIDSKNDLKIIITDINIDKSSKWTKDREVLIKNHNDKMEQEAKKKKILAEKKKREEELQIALSKELEAKKEQYNQLNKNKWKDVIGFDFQCFCDGAIRNCTVLSVHKTKKSHMLECKVSGKNSKQQLKIQNVNVLKEENWGLDKVELYRNRKESEQQAKKYEAPSREQAEIKNHKLVRSLNSMRDEMCGVGTRKVKLMLNKKIKENDKIAELYRVALEVEDCNISAKKYRGTYKSDYYDKKQEKLMELVDLCLIYNDEHDDKVVYGKEFADGHSTNAIVYFELPGCEQISFHTTLSHYEAYEIPNYGKEWDGRENSTMYKLEEAINKRYYKENCQNG